MYFERGRTAKYGNCCAYMNGVMYMKEITKENLEQHILEAIPALLKMAREMTLNNIADNYLLILSEIRITEPNFHLQRAADKLENDAKDPVPLEMVLPSLLAIYDRLHDIDLVLYRAYANYTVIDIRYFSRTNFDDNTRKSLEGTAPMLHCKVGYPHGFDHHTKEQFDINWQHAK